MAATDVGTGISLTFGTSGFSAELLSVNHNAISREGVDTTHMGSTMNREMIPVDLVNPGTVDFEIHFDPDAQPPISDSAETLTITFPNPSGGTSGATLEGTGFVTEWAFTSPLEDKMTASFTWQWDGKTGPTWTASA